MAQPRERRKEREQKRIQQSLGTQINWQPGKIRQPNTQAKKRKK